MSHHGHHHDHDHDHKHKKHKECGCKKRHSKCGGGCRSRCCFPVVFTQVVGTNYCNPFASCCRPRRRGCGC